MDIYSPGDSAIAACEPANITERCGVPSGLAAVGVAELADVASGDVGDVGDEPARTGRVRAVCWLGFLEV